MSSYLLVNHKRISGTRTKSPEAQHLTTREISVKQLQELLASCVDEEPPQTKRYPIL